MGLSFAHFWQQDGVKEVSNGSFPASAQSTNLTRTSRNHPDWGIWATSFKAITSGYFTRVNFKVSSFESDCHNLAMITLLDLRTYLGLINLIAASGKFFFAVDREVVALSLA
jgi:hypothetical protein